MYRENKKSDFMHSSITRLISDDYAKHLNKISDMSKSTFSKWYNTKYSVDFLLYSKSSPIYHN